MKDYKVCIEETVTSEFYITANSEKDALIIAEEKYKKGEFILAPGEVQCRKIAVLSSQTSNPEWLEL